MAAHGEACHSVGILLSLPLFINLLGAGDLMHSCAEYIYWLVAGPETWQSTSKLYLTIFQILSICHWRGSAAVWIRRISIWSSKVNGIVYPVAQEVGDCRGLELPLYILI